MAEESTPKRFQTLDRSFIAVTVTVVLFVVHSAFYAAHPADATLAMYGVPIIVCLFSGYLVFRIPSRFVGIAVAVFLTAAYLGVVSIWRADW